MVALAFDLLGGWTLRAPDGSSIELANRKAKALLAHLALPADKAHSREALATLMWGETTDTQSRASLRQALFALRKASAALDHALIAEGEAIRLDPHSIAIDVALFERHLAAATPASLEAAAALYRGALLEGLSVRAAAFEEWLAGERERLRELALQGMGRLLRQHEAGEDPKAAIQIALRLLRLEPTNEAVHRALMRLYLRAGRRSAAISQYRACVALLRRELDVEPAPETRLLHDELVRDLPLVRPDHSALAAPRPSSGGNAAAWIAALAVQPRIGGEPEMARLAGLLDDAIGGTGGFAVILGEAGSGKSRLAAEVAAAGERIGARLVLGRCHANEQMFPFAPWIDALRAADLAAEPALLAQLNPAWRAQLDRLLPELMRPSDQLHGGTIDHFRLFEAVLELVSRLAVRQPLVLLLEDLHWADSMSLRLLTFLGQRLFPARVLLLASARLESLIDNDMLGSLLEDLARDRRVVRLTLPRLSPAASSALLAGLVPPGLDPDRFAALDQAVWQAAEGNPFMIREIAQAYGEGAAPDDIRAASLPPRVRAVVSGRLDRLSADARALASLISVIGRSADPALLRAAADLDEDRGLSALEELVRRQILRSVGGSFEFTHEAIRRVAYEKLLAPRRMQLHRRVGAALQRLSPGEVGALGYHYLQAESWSDAADHLHRAGQRAVAHAAYREAQEWLEQALAGARRLPRADQATALEADVRVALYQALVPYGRTRVIGEHLAAAADCAAASPDRSRLGWIRAYQANFLWMSGRYPEAAASGDAASLLASECHDVRLRVASSFYLGQVHHFRGDYPQAMALLEQNIVALSQLDEGEQCGLPGVAAVLSRSWLVWSLAELGEFDRMLPLGEETLRLAERLDHAFSMADAYRAVGCASLRAGAVAHAVAILERGMALCRARELALWMPSVAAALGHAYALSGRPAAAIPLLESALEQTRSLGIAAGHSQRMGWLAEAKLQAGEIGAAERLAADALDLAPARHERGHQAWIVRLLGDIADAQGRSRRLDAERCWRDAADLGASLGMRPLVALCEVRLGRRRPHHGHRRRATRVSEAAHKPGS